jgi:hypothetical protein
MIGTSVRSVCAWTNSARRRSPFERVVDGHHCADRCSHRDIGGDADDAPRIAADADELDDPSVHIK